ncbi:hypothetical protein QAD02_021301 [Eretmocerus hayati]|uniref:Uncharacterized protein n=1 Tax=Eretmocerus hayati TaxID=131215 RepID=A0ACC2PPV6_9HYME|nr:hypothetical protein QAD02_021301 [Eretmocerus hayati]
MPRSSLPSIGLKPSLKSHCWLAIGRVAHVAQIRGEQPECRECRSEIANTISLTDTYEMEFSGVLVTSHTRVIHAAELMHRGLGCPEADDIILQCRLWQPRKAFAADAQGASSLTASGFQQPATSDDYVTFVFQSAFDAIRDTI